VYCHKCGAQVDDQAAFCNKCGTALQNTFPAANAVTATRPEVSAIMAVHPTAVQYAGFWRRLAAALIDGLLLFAVYLAIAFVMGFIYAAITGNDEMSDYTANVIAYVAWIIAFLLGWLYWALMESSSKQATLGKMALGIVVTDVNGQRVSFGRASGRYFGKIVSQIILFIGFLMVAFTQKKQGLHDIMASCLVVVKK
jgi:uncharacterized RDD family membrane protein YckC